MSFLEEHIVRRWSVTKGTPVRMLSPRLQSRNGFITLEHDITQPLQIPDQFDVIRAANVLNLAYFDVPTIVRIVRNLMAKLRDGGFLFVARTDTDQSNHGTLFVQARAGTVKVVDRLGRGSEIERHIVDLA